MNNLKTISRIPRYAILIALIFLSGFAEVFGISVLVPVVTSIMGEEEGFTQLGAPFNFIPIALTYFSIAPNFSNVLLVTFIIILSSFLLIHLQERVLAGSRYEFIEKIRDEASANLFETSWEYLSRTSTGELSNKLLIESDRAAENLIALVNIVTFAIHLLAYVVLAISLSWKMSLVAIVTLFVAFVVSRKLIKVVGELGTASVVANNAYNKQIVDIFKGSKLVRALGLEAYAENKLGTLNKNVTNVNRKILVNQSFMKFQVNCLIATALVLVLYSAVVILNVEFSILAVFLFIVLRLAPKFYSLQGQYHSYSAHKASLDIIDQLILETKEFKEEDNNGRLEFSKFNDGFEFHNVSYSYPGSEMMAVQDVSLKINKNEYIAIVGASGAGKSTLLDLILGLIRPTSGELKFNGEFLNEYDNESYRSKIGFVPQDNIIFDGSILENLSLGRQTEEKSIRRCLEIAQLTEFIDSLPKGLNTKVGESGSSLSGGQRQRLSIARALIRQPEILLLDEATSALDSRSEELFQNALDEIARNYTLIVVAHRVSSIRKADTIYVLNDGKLIESGTYNSLIEQDGFFRMLNKSQLSNK